MNKTETTQFEKDSKLLKAAFDYMTQRDATQDEEEKAHVMAALERVIELAWR